MDVDGIAISDNTVLLTDEQSMRIWELSNEPSQLMTMPLPEGHDDVLSVSLSNNGELYAITSFSEQSEEVFVTIVKTQMNTLLKQVKINNPGWRAHFTSDDSLLVLENYPIQIIEVTTGNIIREFVAP